MVEPRKRLVAKKDLQFTMECYTDESFSGAPLAFPANVTRGQDLFAKVCTNQWHPGLFAEVPLSE